MSGQRVSRIMGFIWITTSILWAILSILGIIYGLKWLDRLQFGLEENLGLLTESLDSVENLVVEAADVISATYQSLETVGQSSEDASATITDMRPLIWKTTKVVTEDVPKALDGVQDSMPSLIETAKSVDETLTWISDFQIVIPIPLAPDYVFDFGVSYSPEVPLDQALETMSGNLEEVPDDLRAMEADLDNLDMNLLVIRDDLSELSEGITTLNSQIAVINPRLDVLAENISVIEKSFVEISEKLPPSFKIARSILLGVMGLILLTQVPSLFVGWQLLKGTLVFDGIENNPL